MSPWAHFLAQSPEDTRMDMQEVPQENWAVSALNCFSLIALFTHFLIGPLALAVLILSLNLSPKEVLLLDVLIVVLAPSLALLSPGLFRKLLFLEILSFSTIVGFVSFSKHV